MLFRSESRNWSNLSLDYIPDVLTEEDNYRVINRLQPFNRGKIFLRKAGKKFFSSLDSVNFKLNDAGGNENFYEIRGWAFAGGCPGYEYDVKIILENEGKRFVFDCARTLRPDVEMVFPTQRDCRLSGFVAKISADIIPKGENKIYIALVKPALLSKSRFKGAIRDSGRVLELK